uniref:Uncharacterized protein AlNc14C13G1521 n=1 Tax=Albugo laibachii Nc14 TaxID=890382 RepID=F0W3F3_9STRA|nr:conserved hypothetical protein [Albugo laibachii Nc14]CCA16345.1 conserved hypothetical protein [Albugo laibachii Nc14]|eukprot:CCA16345.1 conserved hypothetical protein [Albugo laibachii Nc14]
MPKFFSPRSKVAILSIENDKGITSKQSMIEKLKSKLTIPKRPAQEVQQSNNHALNEDSGQSHACAQNEMADLPNDEVASPENPETEETSPSDERNRIKSNDLASPAACCAMSDHPDEVSISSADREYEQKHNFSPSDSEKGCEGPDATCSDSVRNGDVKDLMVFGVSPARLDTRRDLKLQQGYSTDNESSKQCNSRVSPSKSTSKTSSVPLLALDKLMNRKADEEMKASASNNSEDDSITYKTDRNIIRPPEVPILASSLIETIDLNGNDEQSENSLDYDPAAAITREFGERVVRLLGADAWVDRQDGLDAVQYAVKKAKLKSMRSRGEYFCAAIAAIQCGLEDRVSPVVFCALQCFRSVAESFAPYLDTSYATDPRICHTVETLTRALVSKLGESNKRTNTEVKKALVRLVKLQKIDASHHVISFLQRGDLPIRVQVNALHHIIKELRFPEDEKNGLSTAGVFPIAVSALDSTDSKTRIAAIDLIADLIANDGKLTVNSITSAKPEITENIRRRVEEILAIKSNEPVIQESDEGKQEEEDQSKGMELVVVAQEDSSAFVSFLEEQWKAACSELGPVISRKLDSKVWSDRKEAFVDFEKRIGTDVNRSASSDELQILFVSYCACIYKYLLDPIAPVVNSVMETFMILIEIVGSNVDFRDKNVREIILQLIMRLSVVMQKSNSRMSRSACRCIMKMTRLAHNNTHPLRYILSCIFLTEMDSSSQMHLLRLLIPEFGFHSDGIDPHRVMTCVANVFLNGNDKARKTAADVVVCTQRTTGKDFVLKYLNDLKPATLKELEKQFVEIEASRSNDPERPQTVHFSLPSHDEESSGDSASLILHSTQSEGNETNWRTLHSAPVGAGSLQCFSTQEEHMMDSILDDFR